MPQYASANRTALRYVRETTFGQTPSSPQLKELRYTGESLNYNLSFATSNEIRADRQTADVVQVKSDAAGSINFELSGGSYDDLILGALAKDAWTAAKTVSGTDLSLTASTKTIASSTTNLSTFTAGMWIQISGFTNSANNGYFQVVSATANSLVLETHGRTLTNETAGASVRITNGGTARNGTDLLSFTLQKHVQDAETPTFFNFRGCRVGSMSLNFAVGQMLTGSFDFMGLGASTATTQFSGASITAPTTTDVLNAVNNVGLVVLNGTRNTACFNTLSLNLNNNLRPQDCVGSLEHSGVVLGRLEVTGDINIYFQDKTVYDMFLNAADFSLSFSVADSKGNGYVISLPRVKFEGGQVVAGGLDTDVMFAGTWRALVGATQGYTIQIDRFVAP